MTDNISFCIVCGARFKEGEGWLDKHVSPCANQRHGWNFTVPSWPAPSIKFAPLELEQLGEDLKGEPDKNRLAAIEDEKLSEGHVYKPRRTQRHE